MTPDSGGDPAADKQSNGDLRALTSETELRIGELIEVQRRLGTPSELPGDLTGAAELVHRINNLRTAIRLERDVRAEDGTAFERQ
jgi:hypothetical protein